MRKITHLLGAIAISASFMRSVAAHAENGPIERGRYLVALGGCAHCHTPGYMLGTPDLSCNLGGSDLGVDVAGLGTWGDAPPRTH